MHPFKILNLIRHLPHKVDRLIDYLTKTNVMQKQALAGRSSWLQSLQKTLLIMKLAVIIILISTLQVNAEPVFGQTVSVNLKNTEVKKVLKTSERDG